MNFDKVELRAQRAAWGGHVELLLIDGQAVGTAVQMETQKEGTIIDPTFRISHQAAQGLIDDLWQAGLRPSEGTGSAGSLKATEKHLADMRKIAFKGLDLEV